jgi:hypothetical protein
MARFKDSVDHCGLTILHVFTMILNEYYQISNQILEEKIKKTMEERQTCDGKGDRKSVT